MQNVPDNVVQFGAVNKNGDTLTANSANTFNGLSTGDYTLFYIDKFGCSTDTVVTVEPVIDTQAAFATNPISGTAPIQINLQNNSVNATDYSWWLNGDYQGNQFSGFFTDTSGTYEIELIAWKTDSICADTVSFTVFISDSLVASLPNVFTPNNDGVNDFFNVKVNLPVSYKLSILNRWGNLVFENEGDLTKGEHKLWNGETKSGEIVTDGTYFYKIVFEIDGDFVDCELTECEVVKQGFVDVRK
ncbi:T9SS type B sorting domain-containing protein [Brumimicrobium oceani]|nr:gliding motility-associated C-terminal domain-containing protein [Brumimicrobium oceani]